MTVRVTFQDSTGTLIGKFDGEDRISLAQMAGKYGIEIPLSCCAGMCGICTCKIVSGQEMLQIDKITTPLKSLAEDEIFACVGGIKSEYLKDDLLHDIVLEKNI